MIEQENKPQDQKDYSVLVGILEDRVRIWKEHKNG